MMPSEFTSVAFISIKIVVLIGIALYAAFAAVIVRQEQLMAHVLEETFEPIIKLLTIVHLAAAIVLFLLALVSL